MRIFLTGGTGFIGRRLVHALVARGGRCVVVSRGARRLPHQEGVQLIQADPTEPGTWQEAVDGSDVVVNLAGEPIVDPPLGWTTRRRRAIRASRVETTRNVVGAIRDAAVPPQVLVSASAIGYYGDTGNTELDEASPAGGDFLARVCLAWEEAARAAEPRTRVALIRLGLVLGQHGGVLSAMLPAFRWGLGGPWGSGKQWWSWIHHQDVVDLILFIIERDLSGPVNLTAPNPVTVAHFAKALGGTLGRPAMLRLPSALLRFGLGEAADALLHLQRALPRRALDAGYEFQFPDLGPALHDIL